MQAALYILIVLQLLLVSGATIAAVVDIESIVATGPACSLLGLVLAALAFRRDFQVGFLFGLSAPAFAVQCFAAIFGLEWSPSDAQLPIGSAIVAYALLAVPAGLFALVDLHRAPLAKRRSGMQYGIFQLLLLTLLAAVVLGLFRMGNPLASAVGVLVACDAIVGYVLYKFYAGRAASPPAA